VFSSPLSALYPILGSAGKPEISRWTGRVFPTREVHHSPANTAKSEEPVMNGIGWLTLIYNLIKNLGYFSRFELKGAGYAREY
jgi:hypothetical protein